jgi:hypothetical protein
VRVLTTTAVLACAVVLGAVVGLLGAFHHPQTVEFGGVVVPVGILAGLAAVLLAQWVAHAAAGRAGAVAVAVGWLLTVTFLGTSRPEGDIVVPGDGAGTAFFWLGVLVCLGGALVATVWSARR